MSTKPTKKTFRHRVQPVASPPDPAPRPIVRGRRHPLVSDEQFRIWIEGDTGITIEELANLLAAQGVIYTRSYLAGRLRKLIDDKTVEKYRHGYRTVS